MNMKEEKIYCGKGKKKKDNWLSVTVNPDIILQHVKEYEGKKYVKLNVNIKDQPDKYGKDVEITIDTWEPGQKKEDKDSLPF